MTIIGINGSPRKKWNTATLLTHALEGAASQGADTELVHLYDLDYKGCISCFACKFIDNPHNGRCAVKDGLSPLLNKIEEKADAIILGSPIYFGSMSGEMRSFMERLLFAPLVYARPPRSSFPRKIRTGVIYTMNVPGDYVATQNNVQHHRGGSLRMILDRPKPSVQDVTPISFRTISRYGVCRPCPIRRAA